MVKETIWRLGFWKISTRRAQSSVNWGSALRLSVTEAMTFFSMVPVDCRQTSRLRLS